MIDFVLVSVHLGRIRDCIIGAISTKFDEAIVKSVIREGQTQRQEIVRSYQTTRMQPKTLISEMICYNASFDQIVNVLVEEGGDLLEGGLVFETQTNQSLMV